jgi:hypothetical protein
MMESHSELDSYVAEGEYTLTGWLEIDGSGLRVFIYPKSQVVRGDDPNCTEQDFDLDSARQIFVTLLINPQRERLCDKPCARCGRYFLKNTPRQTVYCSRNCGKDGTAAYATKRRLKAEHQDKLRVASEGARKWATARTREDWKRWVSKQAEGRRKGLTPKFLTRAVNKGELTEPTKGER